jgi:hypothetical protein
MAALLQGTRDRRRDYDEARRYAAERLRTHTSRLAYRFGLTADQWRQITRGDWQEVTGRWSEPAQSDRGR